MKKSKKKAEKQTDAIINKKKKMKEANKNLAGGLVSFSFAATGALFAIPTLTFISGVGVLYNASPIFNRAKESLFEERKIRIELLEITAIIAALISRYIFVSNVAVLVSSTAQKLKLVTQNRTMESIVNVFGEKPEFVWVLKEGIEVRIPFESIKANDIIVVNAGELIPSDGIVTHGIASIDQQVLTGESLPVEKGCGENVLASTVVISGKLEIRVEKTGAETVASKVSEILGNTANFTDQIESRGQAIADKSVVPAFVVSALGYPIVGLTGSIALLSSDFLDTMRIAAPISMLNFLRNASGNGILIKDGRSLQQLNEIDTIVFDKTGTLTLKQLHVGKIYVFDGMDEKKKKNPCPIRCR